MTQFSPVAWDPLPAPPLSGDLEKNDLLASADLWQVQGVGPEDVIVTQDGSAIVGLDDGRIVKVSEDGDVVEVANVGGRPLGLEWIDDEAIVVCNSDLGLQRVTLSGEVTVLADRFEDQQILLTNNATVASKGTIYFSDSSTRWPFADYVTDLLEGQATGRVFALSTDGSLSLVTEGLRFANGVALDANEESIFIAETGAYRVHRHWLSGELKGRTQIFLDNLAGFPDNLTFSNGILWVSLPSPRQALVDLILPRPMLLRAVNALPDVLKPKPVRHGIILGYNEDGDLVHNLQDRSGRVAITTSARVHDGRLFIGSYMEPHIAVYEL